MTPVTNQANHARVRASIDPLRSLHQSPEKPKKEETNLRNLGQNISNIYNGIKYLPADKSEYTAKIPSRCRFHAGPQSLHNSSVPPPTPRHPGGPL